MDKYPLNYTKLNDSKASLNGFTRQSKASTGTIHWHDYCILFTINDFLRSILHFPIFYRVIKQWQQHETERTEMRPRNYVSRSIFENRQISIQLSVLQFNFILHTDNAIQFAPSSSWDDSEKKFLTIFFVFEKIVLYHSILCSVLTFGSS